MGELRGVRRHVAERRIRCESRLTELQSRAINTVLTFCISAPRYLAGWNNTRLGSGDPSLFLCPETDFRASALWITADHRGPHSHPTSNAPDRRSSRCSISRTKSSIDHSRVSISAAIAGDVRSVLWTRTKLYQSA
jgi:hypothetical protein